MTMQIGDYERRDLEAWIRSEYPDMSDEFDSLPRTLADFVEARYPHLIQEYVEDTGAANIVYCT